LPDLLHAYGTTTHLPLGIGRAGSLMVTLARRGVDCFTMGVPVAEAFFDDELTAEAVVRFDDVVAGA
jgi:transaldolase